MTLALKKISKIDPYFLGATFILIAMGMVMVYSASSPVAMEKYGDAAFYLKRQAFYFLLGLVLMIPLFFVKVRGLRHLAFPGLIGCGILLILAGIPSIGVTAKNAARWISLGGFRFQPSEFLKPFLILYVAAYVSNHSEGIRNFRRGLLPLLLTVGLFMLLLIRQPDFGTAVTLSAVVGVMLFAAGAKLIHLGGLLALGGCAAVALVIQAPYRLKRVTAFLNPWGDPQGSGFQILQSLVAFHEGGVNGQGLGDGAQKLLYLPEAHTDFIFSVIGEELGFLGVVVVIVSYAVLLIQGFRIAKRIADPFASLLALGITSLISLQALINIAVTLGVVPPKGLTLPLVSYGGSSLLTTMASMAVLFSLSSTLNLGRTMAKRRPA